MSSFTGKLLLATLLLALEASAAGPAPQSTNRIRSVQLVRQNLIQAAELLGQYRENIRGVFESLNKSIPNASGRLFSHLFNTSGMRVAEELALFEQILDWIKKWSRSPMANSQLTAIRQKVALAGSYVMLLEGEQISERDRAQSHRKIMSTAVPAAEIEQRYLLEFCVIDRLHDAIKQLEKTLTTRIGGPSLRFPNNLLNGFIATVRNFIRIFAGALTFLS